MCGIWGVVGNVGLTLADRKFLKSAAMAGTVRGVDATGVIIVGDPKHGITTAKKSVDGNEFIANHLDPMDNVSVPSPCHTMIGHNRWATCGAIDDSTAHPFVESGIIGVHNGTLDMGWESDLQVSKKTPVDSQGLLRAIGARGIRNVWKNMHGAAALVWTDLKTERTYVIRNHHRGLSYAIGKTGKLYMASEGKMLSWLLDRHSIFHDGVKSFECDTLYEITGGKLKELDYLTGNEHPYEYGRGATTYGATRTPLTSASAASIGSTTPSANSVAPFTRVSKVSKLGAGGMDAGIYYRGVDSMTPQELKEGIVGEFAERGFDAHTCFCCSQDINTVTYYEEVDDHEIKIHPMCLDTYRATVSALNPLFFIKRNPLNAPKGHTTDGTIRAMGYS